MPVTVFVWLPHAAGIGHASLSVTGGPYISWWPTLTEIGERPGSGVSRPMGQDKALERKVPDYASAPITSLDEGRIARWWTSYSGRPANEGFTDRRRAYVVPTGNKWDMLAANCSNAVLAALLAGGAGQNERVTALITGRATITPVLIREVADALSGIGGADDLDTKLGVLPSEIMAYGSHMARQLSKAVSSAVGQTISKLKP